MSRADTERGMVVGRWIGRHTPRPLIRPLLALAKCLAPRPYEQAVRTVEAERIDGSGSADG